MAVPLNPNSPAAELGRELEVVDPRRPSGRGPAAAGAAALGEALAFSPLVVVPAASRPASRES